MTVMDSVSLHNSCMRLLSAAIVIKSLTAVPLFFAK